MSKNIQADGKSSTDEELSLTCSFGFDFKRRRNLVRVSDSVIAYVIGNLVTFLNVDTLDKIYLRSTSCEDIGMFAVHPDRTHIAVGENSSTPSISVYTYPALELERTICGGAEAAYSAGKFSRDGALLASVSSLPDYWFTLWDWKTGTTVLRAKAYGQEVFDVSFLSDSFGQIITHGTGHIQFWKMVNTFTGLKLQGTLGKFNGEALSDISGALELPFHNMIVTSTEYGDLFIWSDGRIKMKIMRRAGALDSEDANCHDGAIDTLTYVEDESMILTAGEDGFIRKWSVDDIRQAVTSKSSGIIYVKPISESLLAGANIRYICVLNDRLLVQDAGEGSVLSIQNEKVSRLFCAHNGAITGVASSFISSHLYTCGDDGRIHCYDYNSCELKFARKFNVGATCLANLPLNLDNEGKCIAVGFVDGVLRVLVRTNTSWRLAIAVKPHTCGITELVWSTSGKRLAAVGNDGKIFIFNTSRFKESNAFDAVGFLSLKTPLSAVTWVDDDKLAARIADSMHHIDIPADADISNGRSFEIKQTGVKIFQDTREDTSRIYESLSGRILVTLCDSDLTISNIGDNSSAVRKLKFARGIRSVVITHDDSHVVLTFDSGSFELYRLGCEIALKSNASDACDDAKTEFQVSEVADIVASDHLSIEQSLQKALELKVKEEHAVRVLEIERLAAHFKATFDAIVAENLALDKSARMTTAELVVDDTKTQQIREETIKALERSHEELRGSVERAELLARQLQTKYFDKFTTLPQRICTEDQRFCCSSFWLRAESCDVHTENVNVESASHASCALQIEEISSASDKDWDLLDESVVAVCVHEESQITSEARRRAERLERSAALEILKRCEPRVTREKSSEVLVYDLLGCGFPLRSDPDSRVPSEDKLTTDGKLSELKEIEAKIQKFQRHFNERFEDLLVRKDVVHDELSSLCYAKVSAIAKCKIAQLSRLVILQELAIVPEYDAKNLEMHNTQIQKSKDIEIALAVVRQAEIALGEQETRVERHEKVKLDIQADFDKLMAPGVPRKALLRVLQKRVASINEKKILKLEADGDPPSDSDSDFDDDNASYYSSDEDDSGSCPKGCDQLLYNKVCELRTRRFEALELLTEAQRSLDLSKKAHDSALKKLRSIEESARVATESRCTFEKVKQQSLNGINASFVVPVSCIELSDAENLNRDELLVFSKEKLLELESQITKWDAEVNKLQHEHHELKREHASLVAQRANKLVDLQGLKQKHLETQIRKFGKPVVLEELDKVNYPEGAEELKEKSRLQDIQNDADLRHIHREIATKEKELIAITAEHTIALDQLLGMTSAQLRGTYAVAANCLLAQPT